jgi:hypothetical protein
VLLACAECQLSKQVIPTSLLECLRSNTTLQRLYLYGNSAGVTLSPGGGCEDDDRIVEARHWLDVNNSGRSFVSQANFRPEYLPFVLHKVSNQQHLQPSVIYSLLMETPHSICRSGRSTTIWSQAPRVLSSLIWWFYLYGMTTLGMLAILFTSSRTFLQMSRVFSIQHEVHKYIHKHNILHGTHCTIYVVKRWHKPCAFRFIMWRFSPFCIHSALEA